MDLMLFIKQNKETINWTQISELASMYEMKHKVLSVLCNTNELIPEFIPNVVLKIFDVKTTSVNHKYGEVVKWNSTFTFRLFNKNQRIKEFTTLFFEKNISKDNPNYKNRVILNNGIKSKDFKIPNLVNDEDGVEYFFEKKDSNIYICLLLNQRVFKEEKHVILFDFYLKGSNDIIRKTIFYTYIEYPLESWFYENAIEYTSEEVIINISNKSLIKICFSETAFHGYNSNKLSYKTALLKKSENQHVELLGLEFGNNDFFWLEENFGIIEI